MGNLLSLAGELLTELRALVIELRRANDLRERDINSDSLFLNGSSHA